MNTYILYDEDFSQQADFVEKQLSVKKISYQSCEKEMEFHDWLTLEFKNNDIQLLIVPMSLPFLGETGGLLLGLHIRLNYQLPIEKRCIPIVFVTNLSFENILTQSTFDDYNNPQNLLLTEGVYISSDAIDEIKEKLDVAKPLSNYNSFLRRLNIRRNDNTGGHDIANAWGCYKLARVVGISDVVFSKEAIAKHLKQLYAKYLICVNESYNDSKMSYIDLQPINCYGKRILFIDDKYDEGWGDLMSKIFKSAGNGFVCVNSAKYKFNGSFTDYDGFIYECKSYIGQRWDLIIIDIRLNPDEEDVDSKYIDPTEFSGYKLIDEYLNYNKGYQILVSTASNKIWNVNAALKRGAKGYYIKESPEFNYPVSETKRQYELLKNNIQACFDNSDLQDVFKSIEEDIKQKLPKTQEGELTDFSQSISKQLDIAFQLILMAENDEQYAYAYISLYQIIEIVTEELVKEVYTSDDGKHIWCLPNKEICHDYKWTEEKTYQDIGEACFSKGNFPQWKKIANLCFLQWKADDADDRVERLYHQIDKRHDILHPGKNNNKQIKCTKTDFYDLFKSIKFICSKLADD